MKPRLLLHSSLASIFGSIATAADQTWIDTNANNDWNTTELNWDAGAAWTQSNSAIFGGTGETVTLTAPITAESLTFNSSGYTIAGNTLTLAGAKTITVTNASDTAALTSTLTTGTLTKTGDGTLNINAITDISTLNVNAGKIEFTGVQAGNRLANAATVNIATGATVDYKSVNATATGGTNAPSFVITGGTLTATGGDHTHIRDMTLNGGTWTTGTGASTYQNERWMIHGTINVGGSTASTISGLGIGLTGSRTFNVADASGNANVDLTVTANLNNADANITGGIIKEGLGRMHLGTSDYTGTTVVTGGHLLINGTLRNSSSLTVSNGATLELGATNIFVATHGNPLPATKVITADGATLLSSSAMDSRIGNVTLRNGATWTSNRALTGFDVLLANVDTGTTAATVTVANTGGNTTASTMNGTGGIHLQGVQNFDVSDVTGNANADLIVGMTLDNPGFTGGAAGGVNKLGNGTLSLTRQATYTGGTTVTAGTLSLDANGGASGLIRGTVTIKSGATLRLNANDVTGYNTGADRVSAINIEGGTMHISTTQNQTLGSAIITMTGGQITGISNSNLDFFAGSSALNTLASATTSTISGTRINLRQSSVTFDIADGDAATDLDIQSNVYGNSLVKTGAGNMLLSGTTTYTGTTTVTEGRLTLNSDVTSTTSVGTGATAAELAGHGQITGNLTLGANGTLLPGKGGTADRSLTITGNVTTTTGSTLAFTIDSESAYDQLGVGGSIDLDNTNLSITLNDASFVTLAAGQGPTFLTSGASFYQLISGTTTGMFDNVTDTLSSAELTYFGLAGTQYKTNINGQSFWVAQGSTYLVAIPEPSAAILSLFASLGLLRRRR